MDIFTTLYFVALVIEMVIRAPINKKRRQEKMSRRLVTTQEVILLLLLLSGTVIIPIIYAATNWLDFANYTLPVWAGWGWLLEPQGSLSSGAPTQTWDLTGRPRLRSVKNMN